MSKTTKQKLQEESTKDLGSNHINPNCHASNLCLPHGEMDIVHYDFNKIKNFLSSQIEIAYKAGYEEGNSRQVPYEDVFNNEDGFNKIGDPIK